MNPAARDTYARLALAQMPRLLGNQDRNPYSPTYGCFHRDYWLDRTSDFPDALRQMAVQALALAYCHDIPGNGYRGNPRVLEWAIAGLDFWARIQHSDGSFDEFYPNERGWVGPTAFTTYTAAEAYRLLQGEMPRDVSERVSRAIGRAARLITKGESEEDHLANHYALACLAVWKAYELLGDNDLNVGFDRLWKGFLGYWNAEEGWALEYDGVDPGYLSVTVSFLAKLYQSRPDPEIRDVLLRSIEFCSYFVYPDGYYAGSLGSRNTAHFYPHGFEIMASESPVAAAVAEKMLRALSEGKLVPPEIMSDRYMVYRLPEYLQAYLDYSPRPTDLHPLPSQREPFTRHFPKAGIYVSNAANHYVISNLAKGGVVKVFESRKGRLLLDDCGTIGRIGDKQVVTSQWVGDDYDCKVRDDGWEVSGRMKRVPSGNHFTPLKGLVFRTVLIAVGWNSRMSHLIKGTIRKVLMLRVKTTRVRFQRRLQLDDTRIVLTDRIETGAGIEARDMTLGGGFSVRYVPQSRYFQIPDLNVGGWQLSQEQIGLLNRNGEIIVKRTLDLRTGGVELSVEPNH